MMPHELTLCRKRMHSSQYLPALCLWEPFIICSAKVSSHIRICTFFHSLYQCIRMKKLVKNAEYLCKVGKTGRNLIKFLNTNITTAILLFVLQINKFINALWINGAVSLAIDENEYNMFVYGMNDKKDDKMNCCESD